MRWFKKILLGRSDSVHSWSSLYMLSAFELKSVFTSCISVISQHCLMMSLNIWIDYIQLLRWLANLWMDNLPSHLLKPDNCVDEKYDFFLCQIIIKLQTSSILPFHWTELQHFLYIYIICAFKQDLKFGDKNVLQGWKNMRPMKMHNVSCISSQQA